MTDITNAMTTDFDRARADRLPHQPPSSPLRILFLPTRPIPAGATMAPPSTE